MNFNDVISHIKAEESANLTVPAKWGQGRATFGGLIAAMMYQAIPSSVIDGRPIRSIMLSFVAPVSSGDMTAQVKVLRVGKAVTQVQITALQEDEVCAVMQASFGHSRESVIQVECRRAPSTKGPDEVPVFPFIANLTPDFTQYFDYRFTEGTAPFMGSTETIMGGWIKLKETCTTPTSTAQILALLDAWPPAVLSMLKKPAAGSSLTWAINFIDPADKTQADEWWQYEASIQQAQDGYSHIDATMWDKNGDPVVISRQAVSFFG